VGVWRTIPWIVRRPRFSPRAFRDPGQREKFPVFIYDQFAPEKKKRSSF